VASSAQQRAISRRIPESVPDSRRTHHFLESWHREFGPALDIIRDSSEDVIWSIVTSGTLSQRRNCQINLQTNTYDIPEAANKEELSSK